MEQYKLLPEKPQILYSGHAMFHGIMDTNPSLFSQTQLEEK